MNNLIRSQFLIFCMAAIVLSVTANAQVYTNLIPDILKSCTTTSTLPTCSDSYNLDLNNDGIIDFEIALVKTHNQFSVTGRSESVKITPFTGNAVAETPYPVAYSTNSNISLSLAWSTAANQILSYYYIRQQCGLYGCGPVTISGPLGNWNGAVDKYLGLEIIVGANTFYGWVRLNVTATFSVVAFTVKDYAYNPIPGQSILAGQTAIILPLNLLSFEGIDKSNTIDLAWSTANEINNKGFEVERGIDGRNFSKIGFVNGNGNTSSVSNYDFKDAHPGNVNYYRLKQIDNDGRFSYSSIIKIKNNRGDQVINIAPNPVSNSTTVTFQLDYSQNVSMKIYDVNGRLIQTIADKIFEKGEQQIKLNAGKINAGIYFLRIQTSEFTKTEKLMIIK